MTDSRQKLQQMIQQLNEQDYRSVTDYVEYLLNRNTAVSDLSEHTVSVSVTEEVVRIPRPEQETVVAAIQRLSQTYPMLEKSKLLHKASDLMSQHVMQGRVASEVIDELELLFTQFYQHHIEGKTKG